jgi:hypothetical protein
MGCRSYAWMRLWHVAVNPDTEPIILAFLETSSHIMSRVIMFLYKRKF